MRAILKVGALLGALLATAVMTALPAHADEASPDTAAMEQQFVQRINDARARNGVAAVVVRDDLTAIARRWSAKMAADGTLSHNPNLRNEVPANWRKLGENVGEGSTVDSLERAFENSPHHWANMVDPAFNTIGVGVVVDASGTMWVTEDYMQIDDARQPAAGPAPAAAGPAPSPPPAPAPAPAPARAPAPVAAATPAATPRPAAPAPTPAPAPRPAGTAPVAPRPASPAATAPPVTAPTVPSAQSAEVAAAPGLTGPSVPASSSGSPAIPSALVVGAVVALGVATELSVHALARAHRQRTVVRVGS